MKKKKMIIGVVIILGMALLPVSSKAALQANPNTRKGDTATNWIINIRKMEAKNQAMGLEETINSTTLKATSASNGIEVHMIKSTEWGTVAILSTSGYGNSKKIHESTIKTTTGNKSGVYFPLTEYERVAGGISGYVFSGVDSKYYDSYTKSNTSAKIGDALGNATTQNPGCDGWHDSGSKNYWFGGYQYLTRGKTKLFYCQADYNNWDNPYCRAAVVCGEGF